MQVSLPDGSCVVIAPEAKGCWRQAPVPVCTSMRCIQGFMALTWPGRHACCIVWHACRRYTLPEVRQEQYNSCELGAALAEFIIKRFQPAAKAAAAAAQPAGAAPGAQGSQADAVAARQQQPAAAEPQQQQEQDDRLPVLQQGKVVGCQLPSGQTFLCGSVPQPSCPKLRMSPPLGGCTLVSCSGDGASVLSICLDADSTMQQVAFLGSADSAGTAAAAMSLVGLPFSYVASGLGLPDSLAVQLSEQQARSAGGVADDTGDAGEQAVVQDVAGVHAGPEAGVWVVEQDVLAVLQKPWAQLLLHEDFSRLRQQLLKAGSEVGQLQGDEKGAGEQQVQQLVVDFMQSCRTELSGYHLAAHCGSSSTPTVC